MQQFLLMFRRPETRTHEFLTVTATDAEQARAIATEIERDFGLDLELLKVRSLKTGELPD